MEANVVPLRELIRRVHQFRVPCYQRPYSWSKDECQELWDDIFKAGEEENEARHFLGCIICVDEGEKQWDQPVLIIDGQQRVTTVLLLLEALARSLEREEKDYGEMTVSSLRRLMCNEDYVGDDRYKIRLSRDDQQHFVDVMAQYESGYDEGSSKIKQNFEFFLGKINYLGDEEARQFIKGLIGLQVVSILLHHNDDDPQYVFESMNSKGKSLSVSDLIRNYMLMRESQASQEEMYEQYWRPIEINIGKREFLDSFLRDYLVAKKGEGVGRTTKRIYEEFKSLYKSSDLGAEQFLQDMVLHSEFYARLLYPADKESNPKLSCILEDWSRLSPDAPTPLMLALYASFHSDSFSDDDFVRIIRLVESYFFRRWACGMPANARHAVFLELIEKLNVKTDLEHSGYYLGIEEFFRNLSELDVDNNKWFPGDQEFLNGLLKADIGSKGSQCWYALIRLEKSGYGQDNINLDDLRIEHIMPKKLDQDWEHKLGYQYEEIYTDYLHKLGNITLVRYGPRLSQKPFLEKRDWPEDGFGDSALWLNELLGRWLVWNPKKMEKRGKILATKAAEVWALP